MDTATEHCLNCNQPVTSPYCGHCGQNNPPKKLNLKTLWFDFQSRVYGFDGMFPRTLRDLTLRPGSVARSYIGGNRVLYYGPVGYFFIIITVYVLLASLLNVDLSEFTIASSNLKTLQQGEGQLEFSTRMNHWIVENMRLVMFVFALWSVFFTWLFFRKSKYNIVESSVLIFFISGHVVWLTIMSMIVYKVTGYAIQSFWILLFTFGYNIFAYVDLYRYQSRFNVFLKSILLILVSYLSLFLVIVLMTVVYMMLNPELLEKFKPSDKSKIEQTK